MSRNSLTLAGSMGLVKLGQPQPDSHLSEEANSGSPEQLTCASIPADSGTIFLPPIAGPLLRRQLSDY